MASKSAKELKRELGAQYNAFMDTANVKYGNTIGGEYHLSDWIKEYHIEPDSSNPFIPMDYDWYSLPYIKDITLFHDGSKNIFGKITDDKAFKLLLVWGEEIYHKDFRPVMKWVSGRYGLDRNDYWHVLYPELSFGDGKVSPITEGNTLMGLPQRYDWRMVGEVDGKEQFILVDLVTGKEAIVQKGYSQYVSE